MARGIVCIGEFPNGALAALAQGMLQAEGIEAEVAGATVQAWGGGDVPMTGVRLEVRAEDAARARALLDEVESRTRTRIEGEEGAGAYAEEAEGLEPEPEQAPDAEAPGSPPSGVSDAVGTEVGVGQEQAAEAPEFPTSDGPPPLPGDRAARRALACAVFGCMVPIFTLAALALLIDSVVRRKELPLTEGGRRTWRWAVAWNLLGCAALVLRWSLWWEGEWGGSWLWWFWIWI